MGLLPGSETFGCDEVNDVGPVVDAGPGAVGDGEVAVPGAGAAPIGAVGATAAPVGAVLTAVGVLTAAGVLTALGAGDGDWAPLLAPPCAGASASGAAEDKVTSEDRGATITWCVPVWETGVAASVAAGECTDDREAE